MIGAVRYARSLKPRNLSAVHFVIDDLRAEQIAKAWAASDALDDVTLEQLTLHALVHVLHLEHSVPSCTDGANARMR